jgi:hypothetical protein
MHPNTFLSKPINIGCLRCKGRRYMYAGLQTGEAGVPVFDEDVIVDRIDHHEARGGYYYEYKVPCFACAGTGSLSPIPDAELFSRKRASKGVITMEARIDGYVVEMGEQRGK